MSMFVDYRAHTGATPAKFFKATLFQSPHLLLGLNCLEPGQEQHVHTHAGQAGGAGTFTVGDEVREVGEGWTVWAPAEVPHGVTNSGAHRRVLLVGIAPAPGT